MPRCVEILGALGLDGIAVEQMLAGAAARLAEIHQQKARS